MSVEDLDSRVLQLKLLPLKDRREELSKIRSIVNGTISEDVQLSKTLVAFLSLYNNCPNEGSYTNQILHIFEQLVEYDIVSCLTIASKFISQLATKPLATADLILLLDWCVFFSQKASTLDNDTTVVDSILVSSIQLVDSVVTYQDHKKQRSRRLVQNAFKSLDAVIKSIPSSHLTRFVANIGKYTLSANGKLVFFGQLAFVTHLDDTTRTHILTNFSKDILTSKAVIDQFSLISAANALKLANLKEFNELILPGLEKASLRNSEATFHLLAPEVLNGIDSTQIDICEAVCSSKFFVQLLSSLKSSNPNVRNGGSKCFQIIFNHTLATSSSLDKLTEEICKVLKSSTSTAVEQKTLCSEILHSAPLVDSVNLKIVDTLLPMIKKESNEQVLSVLLDTLFHRPSSDKTLAALKTGLSDKKQRKAWTVALAAHTDDFVPLLTDDYFSQLESILDECVTSPLQSVTGKLISGGYAAIVILHRAGKTESLSKSLRDTDKPAILTNFKVYGKLTTDDEQEWFVRSLDATSGLIKESNVSYGYSWVYSLLSSNINSSIRRIGLELLSKSCKENQEFVPQSIIDSINDLLSKESSKFSDYKLNLKKLLPVILTITANHEKTQKSVLGRQLISLLPTLSHRELSYAKMGWVGICQRAGVDPGDLVQNNSFTIIQNLMDQISSPAEEHRTSGMYDAVTSSLALISFIDSNSVAPILSESLQKDLDISSLPSIDDTKIEIWNGQDGVLVVDVLEKNQKKPQLDKNSKDYETLKWEASVRKQVASRKTGSTKKLTKEEQAAVNKQLETEKEIRQTLNKAYNSLRRGLDITASLALEAFNVDNGKEQWFPVAVSGVFNILNSSDALKLVRQYSIDTFLKLPHALPSRGLTGHSTFEWIGASTLRLMKIKLDSKYEYPSLTELVSSQLFSLKVTSDKSPFEALSLMYLLPLISKIIDNGKIYLLKNNKRGNVILNTEFQDEDPEEEQLALALELVSSHSEIFQNASIPRTSILQNLFSLMTVPSKSKMAKDCFNALAQNISVNISPSDLHLILSNAINPVVLVRTAVLEALDEEFDLSELEFCEEIWISVFDNEEINRRIAQTIWDESGFHVDESSPSKLIPFLNNSDNGIRLSIAKALAQAVVNTKSSSVFEATLDELLELYRVKEKPPPPQLDEYGLVVKSVSEARDTWEERSGVALTLKYLAGVFHGTSEIEKVFKFLIDERALGDKNSVVRQELQDAGMKIIDEHGTANLEILIPIFEEGLSAKDEGTTTQDRIKESIIILYGNLARHLKKDDPRILDIVSRLLQALETPSEDVQFAVSECIAPLVSATKAKLSGYFDDLFEKLFEGKNLAQRRGAAYGIAGLVKGAGLKSLAENDIIRNLVDASDDKKNPHKREGVSFAFETLSQSLGSLFEPYVIEILPIVLKNLGDQSPEVREATDYAARMIMKNTTSYGIKKLIPLVISNLEDYAWRTKKGSVELLGSMAYLDPTQLAASLPTIIPQIVSVLNDTHKEVRKAADQSLKRFGEVIRNPEIQELVPTLLKAIGDPTQYTTEALDGLIKTQFVHYIDGPSLALIIHVIHRGMKDRSATTKRKSCQIVGNMAILVDSKDLIPYLSELVLELEEAMVDPVPQTRAVAARALGSLVEKLGEEKFPDLIPRLLTTLQDEGRLGDKMGSAQALAEVTSGIGLSKLDELLPTILAGCTSPKSYVRAGFMPLLLFLPVCFGNQFSPYLSKTISPILSGLADNDEDIRDIALRSGRLIVNNYASKAVDLLLPELELGLSDSNPRIRLSSVELTGDLLFKISGISGKQELSEDLSSISASVTRAFNEVLGHERRDRILAALFMCRSDNSGPVRVAGVNIWKALVANTPKTVKEILPTLTQIIVRKLASPNENQRSIAATTLGDMVKRVGGNALSQLLPTLESSLYSSDSDAKQGICIAVRELTESSSPATILEYQEPLFKIIRETLMDANPGVREAAAQAFDVLQEAVGNVAVDEIIPQLLEMLDTDASENALSALEEIMTTKADVLFPILIPSLLTPPVKAKALGALAQVAGPALYKRLSTITLALVDAIIAGTGVETDLVNALSKTLLSVTSDEGCHQLFQQILSLMRHEDKKKTEVIYRVLPEFFENVSVDYSVYLDDLVTHLILSLDNKSPEISKYSFEALTALVKRQPRESLERLVSTAFRTLSLVDDHELYVFGLPKGPNCLLPIFLNGLMYGNPQQREQSAEGIALIVDRTPADSLRPFVTVIVGPLIRVIGERFNGEVKSAILLALNKLFAKIPQFLRPFVPQLQRTFVKSLSDPSNDLLRSRAARALGTLIEYQPRVDPLVTELLTGVKTAVGKENAGVKAAMLKALLEVILRAGKNMSNASKSGVLALVEKDMFAEGASVDIAVAYAKLVGALSSTMSSEEAVAMLKSKVLDSDLTDESSSRFAILTLNAFLKDAPNQIFDTGLFTEVCKFIATASQSKSPYINDNSVLACGKVMLQIDNDFEFDDDSRAAFEQLVTQLCVNMNAPPSNSPDSKRLSLVVIRTVCRFKYDISIRPYIDLIAPSVFLCVRDPIIPIKLAAEKSFLAIFNLVADEEMKFFNEWAASKSATPMVNTASGQSLQLRSITEYAKRVGFRLANVERERLEAGGDKEAMFSDQFEDEREIWAVGSVDLGKE
ncbi:hypothetical protein OGAPHI_003603 [Ogataea philodendri]|uniref:TOG domain-containing protein n=1 Tax=Ogataea philodendri TaxID=1378263 RepID=A0A9P8T4N1_9ASCO|nr:uncharacterized protein OGAPHI_003603 [Ogataea philodendri]KAH3665419.1 hypothetical protein OGAPHI_003603 [Ogataea philodendri]